MTAAVPDCDAAPAAPRPAAEPLPPGSCHTHVHVFGPQARYPLDARRSYTPHQSSLAQYRQVMQALGIARAVLVQPSVYGTDNRALLDTLRAAGDSFRGVVVPAPGTGAGELRAMHDAGARGIRLNLVNPQILDLGSALAMCRTVAPWGWHLQLFADLGAAAGADCLARLCDQARLPLVVDHMGRRADAAGNRVLLDAVRDGRCWVKLSAPYRVSRQPPPHADLDALVQALAQANPQRLLWGSDWPHTEQHGTVPRAADLGALLSRWFPDPAMRLRICVHNPAHLYQFNPEMP